MHSHVAPRPVPGRFPAGGALLALVVLVGCHDGDSTPASSTVDRGDHTSTVVGRGEEAPGIVCAITGVTGASGVDGSFQAGDSVAVTFTIKKRDGSWWRIDDFSSGRILLSGPTSNYQRVLPEQSDLRTAALSNDDGSYTYTFPARLPAVYAPPLNDTPSFGPLEGELAGQPLVAGTYTVGLYVGWSYTVDDVPYRDSGAAVFDFRFGGAAELAPREVTKPDNCNQCHVALRAHGGSRSDVRLCVLCHTSGAEDRNGSAAGGTPGASIDFRVMIHKIHDAAHLPSVLGVATREDGTRTFTAPRQPYQLVGFGDRLVDFSHVSFPVWPEGQIAMPRDLGYTALSAADKATDDAIRTGVTSCTVCHGDPDGSGPLTAPAQGRVAYAQPTRRACGACHDDVDWARPYTANGSTMPAQPHDASCLLCHNGADNALDPEKAHLHPLRDSSFNPGISMSIASVAEAGAQNRSGTIDPGEKIAISLEAKDDAGRSLLAADIASVNVLISGPTANSNILLNATIPPAALTGSQPFHVNVPMPVLLEYAGTSTSSANETFATALAPHWDPAAATTVYLQAPAAGGASSLVAAAKATQNWLDVLDATGFARNDYVVIDAGVAGKTEYLQIQRVEGNRLWFGSLASTAYAPGTRYNHAPGAAVTEIALTAKKKGTDYSLDAAGGSIREIAEFGDGAAVVVSYTTDFVMPSTFPLALNDTPTIDESGGKWAGKPIVDGTYGVVVYASRTLSLVRHGETNSYRAVSIASRRDFLVGKAQVLEPYALIDGDAGCVSCHQDLTFHGGGRRGLQACLGCHGTAGSEDRPTYVAPNAPPTPGTTINFRSMLHKIHAGSELAQGAEYMIVGFGSGAWPNNYGVSTFEEIEFPAMPGGVRNCTKCHGAANTAWLEPKDRTHPTAATVPARGWSVACGSCHDSAAAQAHIAVQAPPGNSESCVTCHGQGREWHVELMHKAR